MLILHQIIIGLLFLILFPSLLLFVLITGIHRPFLHQRLGFCGDIEKKRQGVTRFWLHGASVGEVKAIKLLVDELRALVPQSQFVVTTMTVTGKKVAEKQFGNDVHCLLLPLDVPLIVHKVVNTVDADAYICIETELWPILLSTLSSKGIPIFLANGRMSGKSRRNYQIFRSLFSRVIQLFDHLSFISEIDRKRFISLGGDPEKMVVDGNIKYDFSFDDSPATLRQDYQRLFSLEKDCEILVGGSTHNGEEEMLVELWTELNRESKLLLVIAPRHLERLPEVEMLLQQRALPYHKLSQLKEGGVRTNPIILVDSYGELALIYSIGTYVFCGGSLVDYGGHNIIEAALWEKAVFYGPSMADFQDGKKLLESAGGGFEIRNRQELLEKIKQFRADPEAYNLACRSAGNIAKAQQGSGRRQAEAITSYLLSKTNNQ